VKQATPLLAAILLASLTASARGDDVSRPNFLLIIADDLNDWVGCLDDHPDARTPNIDRLAKQRATRLSSSGPTMVGTSGRRSTCTR